MMTKKKDSAEKAIRRRSDAGPLQPQLTSHNACQYEYLYKAEI
jgi:hypothetical protein